MSAMETFYASLCSTFEIQDPYLRSLAEIARIDLKQVGALMSDLGWQDWSASSPKPEAV